MSPASVYRAGRCNYTFVLIISADGTFELGPEGWTVQKTATGKYLITHNIGHLRYMPIPRVIAPPNFRMETTVTQMTEAILEVSVDDNTNAADNRFGLVVLMTQ